VYLSADPTFRWKLYLHPRQESLHAFHHRPTCRPMPASQLSWFLTSVSCSHFMILMMLALIKERRHCCLDSLEGFKEMCVSCNFGVAIGLMDFYNVRECKLNTSCYYTIPWWNYVFCCSVLCVQSEVAYDDCSWNDRHTVTSLANVLCLALLLDVSTWFIIATQCQQVSTLLCGAQTIYYNVLVG